MMFANVSLASFLATWKTLLDCVETVGTDFLGHYHAYSIVFGIKTPFP